MSQRRMLRYVVAIDDRPHLVPLTSDPVTLPVAAISPWGARSVEFWTEYVEGAPETQRAFQVFGTGHPLPPGARHVGTCARTEQGFVWHLFEVGDPR